MKYLISVLILSLTQLSLAATTFKFLPLNMNALVMIRGNQDNDFADLYKIMNVPEQDSSLGKGKGLKSSDKGFTLTCSLDKTQCQVILNKSAHVVIDPAKKYLSFKDNAALGEELKKLFVLSSNGELHYLTSDKMFRIDIDANGFSFEANENGF